MSKRVFLLVISCLFLSKTVMAVEHIFIDDTLGKYSCFEKDTTQAYNRGKQVNLEVCKEGLETYRFFYHGSDYHDKCYEQDVETLGYKYRNVLPIEACREEGKLYVFHLVQDQINKKYNRCYEVDEKTYGYEYRNRVDISNCPEN